MINNSRSVQNQSNFLNKKKRLNFFCFLQSRVRLKIINLVYYETNEEIPWLIVIKKKNPSKLISQTINAEKINILRISSKKYVRRRCH